jgi:hypothetical protein
MPPPAPPAPPVAEAKTTALPLPETPVATAVPDPPTVSLMRLPPPAALADDDALPEPLDAAALLAMASPPLLPG